MSEYFNHSLGRWQVYLPDGSRTYRARVVMEKSLGRPLRTDEHVHHINRDKTDDRLENLRLLSASEHAKLHAADRAAGSRALRGDSWGPRGIERCAECGTDERPHVARAMCGRCYFRIRQREKHGHEPRQPATVIAYVCEECGDGFERSLRRGRGFRFCSRTCAKRASARRRWAERNAGRVDAIGKRAA